MGKKLKNYSHAYLHNTINTNALNEWCFYCVHRKSRHVLFWMCTVEFLSFEGVGVLLSFHIKKIYFFTLWLKKLKLCTWGYFGIFLGLQLKHKFALRRNQFMYLGVLWSLHGDLYCYIHINGEHFSNFTIFLMTLKSKKP